MLKVSERSIKKINDELYVANLGDLHFAVEKVTFKNREFWRKYIKFQKYQIARLYTGKDDGILGFEEAIIPLENPVWIAYVAKEKVIQLAKNSFTITEIGRVEMFMSVMIEGNISTHMGISRPYEYISPSLDFSEFKSRRHRNLSPMVHAFGAQFELLISKGHIKFMVTKPTHIMRKIMEKNSLDKDSIWVGDSGEREETYYSAKRCTSITKTIREYRKTSTSYSN